jgi:hypothetical protein
LLLQAACAPLFYCAIDLQHWISTFFTEDPTVLEELFTAKRIASAELKNLHGNWINGEVTAYIRNNSGCEQLFSTFQDLGVILYQSDTLMVYVADWRYQLVGKISRAFADNPSDPHHDRNLMDAVSILCLLVEANTGELLDQALVRAWYTYGPTLSNAKIDFTNQAYRDKFGAEGILS